MPRSRSIFIQSDRVLRRSPLALTWPARLMAPPNSSSFSVSVVLPASGWEMIANVRLRPAGWPARRESRSETTAESGTFFGPSGVRGGSGPALRRQPGTRLPDRIKVTTASVGCMVAVLSGEQWDGVYGNSLGGIGLCAGHERS